MSDVRHPSSVGSGRECDEGSFPFLSCGTCGERRRGATRKINHARLYFFSLLKKYISRKRKIKRRSGGEQAHLVPTHEEPPRGPDREERTQRARHWISLLPLRRMLNKDACAVCVECRPLACARGHRAFSFFSRKT